mgnify:CR=1 FL=1
MDHIVQKAISGNASNKELTELNAWLKVSDENRKFYDEQLLLWQFTGAVKKKNTNQVDVNAAWEQFALIKDEEDQKSGFVFYRIAAVLIVMLLAGGVGMYLYKNKIELTPVMQAKAPIINPVVTDTIPVQVAENMEGPKPVVVRKKRKKKNVVVDDFQELVLPDSSSITLAKNSVLEFLDYTPEQRVVSLAGAGFFNLKPLNQDFVIETKELAIRVEGTKFDIQTETKDHAFIDLYVEEGRMVAYEIANPSNKVILTSNEGYIYDIKKHEFIEVKKVSAGVTRWKRFMSKFSKSNKKKKKKK